MDDDATNNTLAFSACLDALVAAGGGRMVLPRSRLGIYRGNIIVPPVVAQTLIAVEIVGGVAPTPVFGTVGTQTLCSNCSHVVVRSLEASAPSSTNCSCDSSWHSFACAAVIAAAPPYAAGKPQFSSVTVSIRNLEVRFSIDFPLIFPMLIRSS